MSYKFVLTDADSNVDDINVEEVFSAIDEVHEGNIVTVNDYVLWVRRWKEIHRDLVDSIVFFKKEKNRLKAVGQYSACSLAWRRATSLGVFATALYELRAENKKRLKNNEFVDEHLHVKAA